MSWPTISDFVRGDLLAVMQRILDGDEAPAARIEVERIQGPILLVAARDDEMWPALWMSQRIVKRLKDRDFAHPYELLEVAGGHIEATRHFDQVERFLGEVVAQRPGCAPVGSALPGEP